MVGHVPQCQGQNIGQRAIDLKYIPLQKQIPDLDTL